MNTITTKLLASDNNEAASFLFASQQARLQKEGVILAAYDGDTLCGALGAVRSPKSLQILSLHVDEAFRRRGAASALLDSAAQMASDSGIRELSVSYSCTPGEASVLDAFWLKNGFTLPVPGEIVYTVPLSSLENSLIASMPESGSKTDSHIFPMLGLPQSVQENLKAPDYMLAKNAPGRILQDLCLAYVENQQVRSFIVLSDTGNGVLHLHSAFLEEARFGGQLIALLKTAMAAAREKYPMFTALTVTGATPSGINLIEKLLRGAAITKNTAYTAIRPIAPAEALTPLGFYDVFIRFNSLADALAWRGVSSQLHVPDGRMPYMELEIPGTDIPLELNYEALDDDSYAGFLLTASMELPPGSPDAAEKLKQFGNADNLLGIFTGDSGEILLQAGHSEPSEFYEEETLDKFLLPLIRETETIVKFL